MPVLKVKHCVLLNYITNINVDFSLANTRPQLTCPCEVELVWLWSLGRHHHQGIEHLLGETVPHLCLALIRFKLQKPLSQSEKNNKINNYILEFLT